MDFDSNSFLSTLGLNSSSTSTSFSSQFKTPVKTSLKHNNETPGLSTLGRQMPIMDSPGDNYGTPGVLTPTPPFLTPGVPRRYAESNPMSTMSTLIFCPFSPAVSEKHGITPQTKNDNPQVRTEENTRQIQQWRNPTPASQKIPYYHSNFTPVTVHRIFEGGQEGGQDVERRDERGELLGSGPGGGKKPKIPSPLQNVKSNGNGHGLGYNPENDTDYSDGSDEDDDYFSSLRKPVAVERQMSLRSRKVTMVRAVDVENAQIESMPLKKRKGKTVKKKKGKKKKKKKKKSVVKIKDHSRKPCKKYKVRKSSKMKKKYPRRKSLQNVDKVRGLMKKSEMRERLKKTKQQTGRLDRQSVEALKTWFVDNMYNPYPNADEKEKLMRKTGLDKTKLDYWFTNKRKRVWRIYIEELASSKE